MTVPKVEYVIDTSKAMPKGGEWTPHIRAGAGKGIRRALSMVERHHKTEEMLRASKRVPPVPDFVTRRTGSLSRSLSIRFVDGELQGTYGSALPRARILEEGGDIPKISSRGKAFIAHYEPRPGLKRTAEKKGDEAVNIIADEIKKAVDSA